MLVEIRNIEDDGENISCTYYPERKINDEKRLTISKKTGEIVSYSGDQKYSMYRDMARTLLENQIGKDEYPEFAVMQCG